MPKRRDVLRYRDREEGDIIEIEIYYANPAFAGGAHR